MDANKKFWREFFEMYRAFPCLWKIKCPEYSNRAVKNSAYEILVEKFKEIYPEADKQLVLKKINIIRTCHRRESKKLRDSLKSGCNERDVYVPTLWYFDLLTFLVDQDNDDDEVDNCQKVDECPRVSETCSVEADFLDEKQSLPSPRKKIRLEEVKQFRTPEKLVKQKHQQRLMQQQKKRISELLKKHQSKKQQIIPSPPPLKVSVSPQTRIDEETATISSSWGILYRDLTPRQKLYANKAVTEVLYQGALGKLHEYSYKAIENQQTTINNFDNRQEITTIDRVSYNDPEYQYYDQITTVTDALNYLKPLEEYIVRENHAAMGLISQLEDTLRNLAEDPEYYN